MKRALTLGALLAASACLDTGRDRAAIPLRVAGTETTEPVTGARGWLVELERAELAFGPLYLCAGYQAGSLCETARVEWVESAVVDALDPAPREAGVLRGVTGPVRSFMYDLGITSLLSRQRPVALPAAEELGDNSVILRGVARKEPHAIPFRVELPLQREDATELGVPLVRKSGSDRFEHEVTGGEEALTVRFDARAWILGVDFEALIDGLECSAGASGCREAVSFAPGSQGALAVRNAVVAGERPEFEWSNAP